MYIIILYFPWLVHGTTCFKNTKHAYRYDIFVSYKNYITHQTCLAHDNKYHFVRYLACLNVSDIYYHVTEINKIHNVEYFAFLELKASVLV